jgi:hypothetical protein
MYARARKRESGLPRIFSGALKNLFASPALFFISSLMTTSDKRLATAGYYNARYDLFFALSCVSEVLAVVLVAVLMAPVFRSEEALKTGKREHPLAVLMIPVFAVFVSCVLVGLVRYARVSSVMILFAAFDTRWMKSASDDLLIPPTSRSTTREELAKLRAGMRIRYAEMMEGLCVFFVVDTLLVCGVFFAFNEALLYTGLYLVTFAGMKLSTMLPPLPIPALTWPDQEEEKTEEGKKEK